jgi:protein tyrosine kinase modulator
MVPRELAPADYIAMFRRRWVLILVLTLVGGPLAYGVSRLLQTVYKSTTLVLVEQPSVPRDYVEPVDQTDLGQRLASMQQQILSRAHLEPIIHQLGLFPDDVGRVPMEDLVLRLQKAIDVTPVLPMAETRSINLPGFFVSVTLPDPRTAQEVCTAVTSLFIEQENRLRQQRSETTTNFLSQQMNDAKANLDAQDAKLAAFQRDHFGALPDDEQTNLNILMNLNSQLDAATQSMSRAQQDKSFAETMLAQQIAEWQASQTRHDPETLQQQLGTLEARVSDLETRYTDDYPDVIKAKRDVAALKAQIAQNDAQKSAHTEKPTPSGIEPTEIVQLRARIRSYDQVIAAKVKEQDQIKSQIESYQARVQSSPSIEEQYKELTRGYQTALESYNDLERKRFNSAMATDLEREQEGEQFRVLDPANLPDKPSFPDRVKFTLGGFGGGFALGLGLALLLEMRDSTVRTERDVEMILRLPVLCILPTVDPLATNKSKTLLLQPGPTDDVLGIRS